MARYLISVLGASIFFCLGPKDTGNTAATVAPPTHLMPEPQGPTQFDALASAALFWTSWRLSESLLVTSSNSSSLAAADLGINVYN